MGIRSLNSLFDKNPDLSQPYKLHDTRVVFDGYNLVNFLYHKEVPWTYGGDYDRYAAVVKEYFSSYLRCNITPIVIFDGGHDKTDRKLRRIIERTEAKIQLVSSIANKESFYEKVLPIFACNVFIDVIKDLNIAHAQSSYEADGPMTSIANHYQCPVISLDSDFYVFNIGSGFIRSDCVDTTVKFGVTGRGKLYKYLRCRIYTIDYFLSFFPGVQKSVLPLFGTLLGNDFVDVTTFEDFFLSGEFPKVKSENRDLSARHRRIVGLLEWLKMYHNVDDAIEAVLRYLPEGQKRTVKELVKQAINAYKVPEPYLVKYIDPTSKVSNLYSATPEETLLTSDSEPLPPWFIDNFHKANLSSYAMNVVGLRRMILPTQVEDTALPSSHNCSLAIRQVLYGLLVSLDGMSRDKVSGIHVQEYDRVGNKLQQKSVKPIVVVEGFGPLPNLSERQLDTTEGKRFVSCTLGEQNIYLDDLPDVLQLLVMNIRFWLRTCSPKPATCFFDALLLTVLYLHIAEPESSDERNLATDACRFSPRDYKTASVLDLMGEVLPVDVACFRQKFRRYCQQPFHSRENPFDISITHSYSQLQGCFFYSLLINDVMGQPFATPKLQCTFSGSMIYNVTSKLQRSPGFIRQAMGYGSSVEHLFCKLKNKVLENLPQDCLPEPGLFGWY